MDPVTFIAYSFLMIGMGVLSGLIWSIIFDWLKI